MSILNIFQSSKDLRLNEGEIFFGRFTDINKTEEQQGIWDKAVSLYRHKDLSGSIEQLLKYLRLSNENLSYEKGEEGICFKIFQGTSCLEGSADNNTVSGNCKILEGEISEELQQSLRLYAENLQICNLILNSKEAVISFNIPVQETSPEILFMVFKEALCTPRDIQKLLFKDINGLKALNKEGIIELPDHVKEFKFKFYKKWLEEIKLAADSSDTKDFTLRSRTIVHRLDYLLLPEGDTALEIERLKDFFKQEDAGAGELRTIKDIVNSLHSRPKERVKRDFHDLKLTFGILPPVTFQTISDFIFNELEKAKGINEKDLLIHYEYITAYCLSTFGMYEPCKELLNLLMKIFNPEFYKDAGYKEVYFNPKNGSLNGQLIEEEISRIIKIGRERFPHLMFLVTNLNFTNREVFTASFFKELDYLNFTNGLY
jgi:uncharacterized protein YutD